MLQMHSLGISDLPREVVEMGRKALLSLELSVEKHVVTGELEAGGSVEDWGRRQTVPKPNNYPNVE